ncbi:MAG: pyruvate carboxylase subunit B [Ruminococcaceae bacterium]|nr:pyruvate carboxylase subunit B [Oscillospiraceae bacterium]
MKQIKFTETLLRDANQSLIATRMPFSDFEAMLDDIEKAGYYSVECWGGATFDSCLRYLDEDPWERLRKIKSHLKTPKLQMLLRGQNLLGYKHYPDDVVRMFVAKAIENGIDIIRIFDALNDLRNIEISVDETIKRGGHAQGTIVYTLSPIHNLEAYVKLGKDLENMGVSSVCIKDMAGIMSPQEAYDLVSALKETIKLPIVLHTHSTTGLASMTYLKAAEAGVDVIDTAICSMSGGTSQPGTETLDYVLRQMGFETGLDTAVLKSINDKVKPVRNAFLEEGKLDPLVLTTDSDALSYQIPGGMLSNLIAQLKAQNAMDKLPLVLEETPRVRKDLGYPPLVTPMSQMVGVQAATNVLVGQRYKNVGKEVKAYIKGEYGKAPGEINPELIKLVLGDEKPIEERFAKTLPPAFEETKEKLKGIAQNDEDVLSYIAFPEVAMKFFENRENKRQIKVNYTIKRID